MLEHQNKKFYREIVGVLRLSANAEFVTSPRQADDSEEA